MKRILSDQNPEYKELEALNNRKSREKTGLFLAEGYHLIREAVRSGLNVRTVYADGTVLEDERGAGQSLRAFLAEAEADGRRAVLLSGPLFARLARTETPQPVIAAVEKPAAEAVLPDRIAGTPGDGKRILVLDRIQDPGNLGTLFRTAEAAGFDGVLLVKGTADPYSPKVLRATQGSIFRLRFGFTEGAEDTLRVLKQAGKTVYVSALAGAKPAFGVPMKRDFALVIGNEGGGVSEAFLEGADERVTIPMEGETESLNASIAGAVLLFESVRQRLTR